jgi:serine/threonine protein kinase
MPFFCIHCRSEIEPRFKACPHCGEAVTDFLRRYLETPIDGKYQILGRLGVGGMGEVYKALHVHLNALRVLKLMRSKIASDPGAHERFLREARMATRIHHPNVAALFDFSTLDDGSRYMVWEYIEGINLHELIVEKGALSPRYAARLAAQALHGLDAIHRAGIVHRDISPENLMITRDEEGEEHVKIIDLGIAKQWSEEGDEKTKTGMFVGKWKYCSPEHLGMLPAGERIDGRADIYSFGIVLYEMLTGVPPFQADTPHRFVMLHASERPKALREVNPSVTASAELEALLFRALEKDRNQRFATAREFARALEALVPSLDDTPGAPPPVVQAMEVTAEPTRVSPKPTVPQTSQSTTLQTMVTAPPPPVVSMDERTLARTPLETPPPVSEPASSPPRRRGWTLGALVAVIAAIVAGVLVTRKPAPALPTPPPAAVLGHVGINAFPWANVTAVRNLASGAAVALPAPLVTPAPMDLAPGRYEITLSNPSFHGNLIEIVDVRGNEEVVVTGRFLDPTQAPMPRFEGPR